MHYSKQYARRPDSLTYIAVMVELLEYIHFSILYLQC